MLSRYPFSKSLKAIVILSLLVILFGCEREPQGSARVFADIQKCLKKHGVANELVTCKTAETTAFEGPVGLLVINDNQPTQSEGISGTPISYRLFLQQYNGTFLKAKPDIIGPDALRKELGILADIRGGGHPFQGSNQNIIIIPNTETTWNTIRNIMESCGMNLIWKISFLVRQENRNIGAIPSYLPTKRLEGIRMELPVPSIHVRIREKDNDINFDHESFGKRFLEFMEKIEEDKSETFVRLEIENTANFRQIIRVIDAIRYSGFKQDIEFSILPPRKNTPNIEIKYEARGIIKEEIVEEEIKRLESEGKYIEELEIPYSLPPRHLPEYDRERLKEKDKPTKDASQPEDKSIHPTNK